MLNGSFPLKSQISLTRLYHGAAVFVFRSDGGISNPKIVVSSLQLLGSLEQTALLVSSKLQPDMFVFAIPAQTTTVQCPFEPNQNVKTQKNSSG